MIAARPATADDIPFVLDSWRRDFTKSVYAQGLTHAEVRGLMAKLLHSRHWNCSILHETDVPGEIICWAVWHSQREVAWIHTKGIFRRKGMAKRLHAAICNGDQSLRGDIMTQFIPSPAFARRARAKGWNLLHRPWAGLT